MAKKPIKSCKKSRINPIVKTDKTIDYADLKKGDCFLYKNSIWVKEDNIVTNCQGAIDLSNGNWEENLCGAYVAPVDITINWKRRA